MSQSSQNTILKEVENIAVWKLICTFAARKVQVCTNESKISNNIYNN